MTHPDTDFHAWTMEAAERVRARQLTEEDYDWIAEEIESMGISNERELESRLLQILMHLLKWQYQPEKRKEGSSWRRTLRTQRRELTRLIRKSPSLKPYFQTVREIIYDEARADAADETGLPLTHFPETFEHTGWTWEQVLDLDFYPEGGDVKPK